MAHLLSSTGCQLKITGLCPALAGIAGRAFSVWLFLQKPNHKQILGLTLKI
ncbi:hypothetical protein [Longitalea luteola]|uniref:hypothetical protein n=1 Tax=Longitalea luteola TaxID=2812563 RepID=UPI001A97106B|nr:hypothetical protein [Longitalea luteola]